MAFATATDPRAAFGEITVLRYRNIYASGPIASGDTDRFVAFVKAHKLETARVIFD